MHEIMIKIFSVLMIFGIGVMVFFYIGIVSALLYKLFHVIRNKLRGKNDR